MPWPCSEPHGGLGRTKSKGAAGGNTLDGGHDADILYGGSGADVLRFDFGGGQEAPGDDVVRDFDPGVGDVLRFVNVLDVGGDGPDLGDFSAAVSSVQDDGSEVTLVFEDGGTLWLGGLATGAIDSVNALLSEIGQSSIEVV